MFCHLHLHSEYSICQSSIKIEELIDFCIKNDIGSVALTDTAVMHGAVQFYFMALKNNIKPIIGSQIFITNKDMLSSLILLAKDIKGYKNLCKIVTASHLNSATDIPSISLGELKDYSAGLIAINDFNKGEISLLLMSNKVEEAYASFSLYKEIFGTDYIIEIQRYPADGRITKNYNEEILKAFAYRNKISIIASNDVHYLKRKDHASYKMLARLKAMQIRKDPSFRLIEDSEHYFKSQKEMEHLFKDIREAADTTGDISDRCELLLEKNHISIPDLDIPKGLSQEGYLKSLCVKGLDWRYGKNIPEEAYGRLDKELGVINKMGLCQYFLMVYDIARFALDKKIPICGKGSAASSILTYLLGISNVDPIENNLYFERFLNEGRKSLPDIDIDMSSRSRKEVIDYLISKYGLLNISRVCSFNTLKRRASVREAGRILNFSKEEIDDMLRSSISEDKIDGISQDIKGYVSHISLHPSAFIISGSDISERVPLMVSHSQEVMTQYDMESIERLGLIKIDIINSLTLDLIEETIKNISASSGTDIDLTSIKYDDADVFKNISSGNTTGVFQLESMGIRSLAKKVKPACLNDITFLLSLYRPGPLRSGMSDVFIARKAKRKEIDYMHKDLEPILAETYGIFLYQEQVMQAACKIAGYSFAQADNFRKAISKLSDAKMQEEKKSFIDGAVSRGYDIYTAKKIFDIISKFASYGFVKAHAASYAEISYKSCYLKTYYPAEFLAVMLTNNSGYYPKEQYIEEARRLKIEIKLPDINKSSASKYLTEDDGLSIRIPLIQIRQVGATLASIIEDERKKGAFRDLYDFCFRLLKHARISKSAVSNIIKAGAFDFTGINRKSLISIYDLISKDNKYPKKPANDTAITGLAEESRAFSSCESSFLENDLDPFEKMQSEDEILGFYVSKNPLEYFKDCMGLFDVIKSGDFKKYLNKSIYAAGTLISRRKVLTKTGRQVCFLLIEDEDGIFESLSFSDIYLDSRHILIKGDLAARNGEISLIVKEIKGLVDMRSRRETKRFESLRLDILGSNGR